ncbi:hypothetical protein [Ensifer sp. ENS11]|uniref:hypothetical protein n=1 Tax=Ensifer sp. ENS11 TaxID=2769291 RepID=UPI00177E4AC7|nr:hypothetical protein [Ensifer sp. ENS11]MBD9488536.1 hypothetical protein [Ensifer sp. ENS11]
MRIESGTGSGRTRTPSNATVPVSGPLTGPGAVFRRPVFFGRQDAYRIDIRQRPVTPDVEMAVIFSISRQLSPELASYGPTVI